MPDYHALARQYAQQYGVDPNVFEAQIQQESGFNPNARSGAGAIGIAQFMPGTAAGYHINPSDPVAALRAAAQMDRDNLARYGSYARMLSAYNSGRPDAYQDPNFAHGQTYNYVRTILSHGGGSSAPAPGTPAQNGGGITPSATPQLGGGLSGNTKALLAALKMNGADPTVIGLLRQHLGAQASESLGVPRGAASVAPASLQGADVGNSLVKTALTQMGKAYQWGGGTTLGQNTDCSGLLVQVYGAHGVNLPRTTYDQWRTGRPVSANALKAGDAVFFHMGPKGPEHVGMYIGGGKFIEDPHTGSVVHIENLSSYPGFVGARRFV